MKLKYNAKMHGYWLDGKRCKSPSGVAKVPDDQTSLNRWKLRQALTGVALRPELATRIAAANGDKDTLDAICEEAIHAAGGNAGRDRGSAVHAITEHLDGGAVLLETPEVVAVRQQWNDLLDRYGLEVIHTEGVILHPELKIAGRFDRLVRCPDGKIRVGDIKTGADANKYLHAHAVQLWLYASAPLLADGPQGDADFEIDEFVPMPDIDQEVAYVFHLPAEGVPDVIGVDIAAGADCYHNVIAPIWGWRNRRNLRVEVEPVKSAPMPKTTHKNNTPTVTATVAPTEGDPVTDVDDIRTRYLALDPAARAWVDGKRAEALAAGVDFHLANCYTQRRLAIMDGLCVLAVAGATDDDLTIILEPYAVPTVGHLDHTQADDFAAICTRYAGTPVTTGRVTELLGATEVEGAA